MRIVFCFIATLAIGCGKDTKSTGSGNATPAPAGDCKTIALCEAFPSGHVDSLCGTKVAKTQVTHVDSTYITDQCTYMNPNGSTAFEIGQLCMSSAGGGTAMAKQMFDIQRDDLRKNNQVTAMPGLGDDAYYSKNNNSSMYGTLWVRRGNAVITIAHSQLTPETEEALKSKCILALYNELAAKQ